MKLYTVSAVQCLTTALALLSVSPEPPVCPSCQGDNTILLPGLNIISQFFHFSAPVINFWSLLHKILCNVFFRCLFFWSLLANGSGELGFSRLELLLTFTCSWKEPPALSCCQCLAVTNPNRLSADWGRRDHCHGGHVSPESLRKTGDTCSLSVTVQLG